ncbi:hypothetical protein QE152_g8574 [Popillia japonica]|uniref:Uncharacterized protein n=1 Tax=Popillia japonica TaxID=7064 RepID=A0AAW1M396_POPJA
MMERTQRNMLLRVESSYRTVSLAALQVITGVAPIELQVSARKYLYDDRQEDRKLARIQARAITLSEWQNKSEQEKTKALWSKRLIRDIPEWVDVAISTS